MGLREITVRELHNLPKMWRGTPVPHPYQAEWRDELEKMQLQSFRLLSGLASLLVLLTTILDYILHPEHLVLFVWVRVMVSSSCLLMLGLSYWKTLQRQGSMMALLLMWMIGASIAYMIRVLGYDDGYYAGLNLVYLAAMMIPWGMGMTLLNNLMVYGFYLIPILLNDWAVVELAPFVNNNLFQLETIAIAVVVNHFQSRRRNIELLNRLTTAHHVQALEVMDRYKRDFIANVSHELKTPLAIALGNTELMLEQAADENFRSGLDLIHRSTLQLANHVDRIIAVAHVDDPDVRLDLANYDYCGIVESIFSVFESRARVENIDYRLQMDKGPLVVKIDIVQIEEVLSNLIQNAFKFTPVGGAIVVQVKSDGERVYTTVTDTGIGIPKEKQDEVFERMVQGDEGLSKRHAGMGLGLYICKKNVANHNGAISVESNEGEGTQFKFSLPMHIDQSVIVKNAPYVGRERRSEERRQPMRPVAEERRMSERRRSFEYQQGMGLDELARISFSDNVRDYEELTPNAPSILILEDNLGMMKVIVEALKDDYNLILASDAGEALSKLSVAYQRISLILSDIMMPGMNGFEFLEQVMQQKRYQHIPVIFITALMSHADQLRGFKLGATDYIVKPYNIKILKEKVDHWIARRQYEVLLQEASIALEERVSQLSRAKDIVLHEISNPLQMISGASYFIGKLRESNIDRAPERERRLWESSMALEHGIQAIRGVLETTRSFDMDGMTFRRPIRIGELVNEAVVQTRHLLENVELKAVVDDIANIHINCDAKMLVQVLVNLIRNGVEAVNEISSNNGIVQVTGHVTDEQYVVLNIVDNGIGMDGAVLENLFTFKYTSKKNGNGIGLHLAKMIVKFHDGTIHVDSEKGRGTTFSISLPISVTPPAHLDHITGKEACA